MVESVLEKVFLKFLHAGDFIKVSKITNSVIKITIFPHGGISKYFTIIFRPKMVFLKTETILRVKTIHESFK